MASSSNATMTQQEERMQRWKRIQLEKQKITNNNDVVKNKDNEESLKLDVIGEKRSHATMDDATELKRQRLMKFKEKLERNQNSSNLNATTQSHNKLTKSIDEIDLDAYLAQQTRTAQEAIQDSLTREREVAKGTQNWCTMLNNKNNVQDEEDLDQNENKRCYICKKSGHTKSECPDKTCLYCRKPGHNQDTCSDYLEAEKQKRNEKWKQKKKEKRREYKIALLRQQSGVYDYENLYQILRLPTFRFCNRSEITKAFHNLSVVWHPDKWTTKSMGQQEIAAKKYEEIQNAFNHLISGLDLAEKSNGTINALDVAAAKEEEDDDDQSSG